MKVEFKIIYVKSEEHLKVSTATKQCCGCKKRFPTESMIKTPVGNFHSKQCRYDYATKKPNELKKKTDKRLDDEFKVKKAKFIDDDLPKQHNLTQTVFNRLRVLQELKWFEEREIEPYCISCGKTNMDWCCGHFKTRGSQSNLRYDFNNAFLQCNRYCNMALSGNIEGNKNTHGYKQGLINRFGGVEAVRIIEYCETNTKPKKWTTQEVKELRIEFNKEIKGLT